MNLPEICRLLPRGFEWNQPCTPQLLKEILCNYLLAQQTSFKWMPSPAKTEYGAGVLELLVAVNKDETMRIYVHAEAVLEAEKMLKEGLKP